MKKIVLLSAFLSLIFQFNLYSQTICDSIQVENVILGSNSIEIQVYNSSQQMIVYPIFTTTLDENPYISMQDTVLVLSFLSTANDVNNGFTNALYSNVTFASASSVPANTVFTGKLVISDPNDPTFICEKSFSFNYGTGVANISEQENIKFEIYPNPNAGDWMVATKLSEGNISLYDVQGKLISSQIIESPVTRLTHSNPGVYFLKVDYLEMPDIELVIIE